MSKIGIVGGLSWESTKEYVDIINRLYKKEMDHFPKISIEVLDFD
jgi:aspartate/glutamate racemase